MFNYSKLFFILLTICNVNLKADTVFPSVNSESNLTLMNSNSNYYCLKGRCRYRMVSRYSGSVSWGSSMITAYEYSGLVSQCQAICSSGSSITECHIDYSKSCN
jgi:hypothetical protein